MNWIDIIIALSGIIFCYALIPQILKNYRQKMVNQISWLFLLFYVFGLILLEIGFLASQYWISSCLNAITIGEYFVIAYQKIYYEKRRLYYVG